MHWYLEVWRKYATFSGRARRSEYWYFALFNGIAIILLYMPAALFLGGSKDPSVALALFLPYFLYILAVLLPGFAVNVRRLHDVGRSGWWTLIALVPLVGGIVLLVFHCTDSDRGPNKYGPNPKEISYALDAPLTQQSTIQ